MPRERSGAFAPGRVNLIGEHTDYNLGLALPFAIAEGITVRAEATDPASTAGGRMYVHANDLGEWDDFTLAKPPRAEGWRAFVRGMVAELGRAGFPLVGARMEISGDLPRGAGLSSSAALEVALCLALLDLGSGDRSWQRGISTGSRSPGCARVSRTTGSVRARASWTNLPRSSAWPNARSALTSTRCRSIPCH